MYMYMYMCVTCFCLHEHICNVQISKENNDSIKYMYIIYTCTMYKSLILLYMYTGLYFINEGLSAWSFAIIRTTGDEGFAHAR